MSYVGNYFIKEVAVVRNNENRTLKLAQSGFDGFAGGGSFC